LRPSLQIGDLDFVDGTLLNSTLRVADSTSRDRWQPRVFVLNSRLKALYFWAGTMSDIIGAMSKVWAFLDGWWASSAD
jgi:hypothetical protein